MFVVQNFLLVLIFVDFIFRRLKLSSLFTDEIFAHNVISTSDNLVTAI